MQLSGGNPTPQPTSVPVSANPVANTTVTVHEGPSSDTAVVITAQPGQQMTLAGQDSTGQWLQLASGYWVTAVAIDNIPAGLPVVDVVARPAEPNSTATSEPLSISLSQIGDYVTLGELRWHVVKAESLGSELTSDNQFIDSKTTAGKFVAVYFDVENLGKDPTSFFGVDLVDGVERQFGAFDEGFMFVPNELQCTLAKMNPNLPLSCMVIFEIPADATELKLKVTSQVPFGDEALIALGL
jgi:hypothetical protein